VVLVVLAYAGFLISFYLTLTHYRNLVPPCYVTTGCESVVTSPYSTILGIPLSLIGAVYFAAMFFLGISLLMGRNDTVIHTYELLAFVGILAAVVLLLLQAVVLKAYCIYCLGTEVIALLIWAGSLLVASPGDRGAIADSRSRQRPRSSVLAWKGTRWAGGTLVLIVGALAISLLTGSAAVQNATTNEEYAHDITAGPPGAKVVLVEYADFQCSGCAGYAKLLTPLRSEYRDEVLFVFRFFPLANHRWGMISSQVAYAAFLQGRFWEMHDLLYENQKEWSESSDPRPYFDAYATRLGLDIDTFHEDADAQSTRDFINRQATEGSDGGVNHTPWFFLNGSTIQPRDTAGFRKLIDAQL